MDPMRTQYKELSEGQKALLASMKNAYAKLFEALDACGGSRKMSLAKTKLEESCMWAVKHLTA